MKRCSLLVIRAMKIKTIMRYHYHTGMSKIKEIDNTIYARMWRN